MRCWPRGVAPLVSGGNPRGTRAIDDLFGNDGLSLYSTPILNYLTESLFELAAIDLLHLLPLFRVHELIDDLVVLWAQL